MKAKKEKIDELDSTSFDGYIADNRYVLVDFWAPWCMPCQLQGRMLRSKRDDIPEQVKVAKINVDRNQDISRQYNVRGIPQMYLFVDGKPAKGWTGVTPVNVLVKDILAHI